MSELISDLIPMVSTRKKDNKSQIVIFGMKQKEKDVDILGYNPLLLIDGVPVLNSETFLKTAVPDIERNELIYLLFWKYLL